MGWVGGGVIEGECYQVTFPLLEILNLPCVLFLWARGWG